MTKKMRTDAFTSKIKRLKPKTKTLLIQDLTAKLVIMLIYNLIYTTIISEFVNLKQNCSRKISERRQGPPSLNSESDFFDAFGQTGILHILQNSRHTLFSSTSVKGSPGF